MKCTRVSVGHLLSIMYLPILCTIVIFSDEIIMVDPKLDTAF